MKIVKLCQFVEIIQIVKKSNGQIGKKGAHTSCIRNQNNRN